VNNRSYHPGKAKAKDDEEHPAQHTQVLQALNINVNLSPLDHQIYCSDDQGNKANAYYYSKVFPHKSRAMLH